MWYRRVWWLVLEAHPHDHQVQAVPRLMVRAMKRTMIRVIIGQRDGFWTRGTFNGARPVSSVAPTIQRLDTIRVRTTAANIYF